MQTSIVVDSSLAAPLLRPTPELFQHHEISRPIVDGHARRSAYRIVPRFEKLCDGHDPQPEAGDARVGYAEVLAGERWRKHFETGQGIRDRAELGVRAGGAADGFSFLDLQLDAMAEIRAVQKCVGGSVHQSLIWLIVDDLPFAQIGERCSAITPRRKSVSAKTAKVWCCDALRALSAHYAERDGVAEMVRRAGRIRVGAA